LLSDASLLSTWNFTRQMEPKVKQAKSAAVAAAAAALVASFLNSNDGSSIQQAPCRKGKSDTGKMFGIGRHVQDGRVQYFATKKGFDHQKLLDMCNQASTVFEELFLHQVIAMQAAKQALGIVPKSSMTQGYNQSVIFGNARHFDVMDASTGIQCGPS
jgi:hypothetical protein